MDSPIDNAAGSAQLSLPLPRGTRFRLLRCLLVKLMWPVLHNQLTMNEATIEEFHRLRPRMDRVDGDLEHHSGVLTRQDVSLTEFGGHATWSDEQLLILAERIELAERQAFARHQDGMGALRGDFAELVQSLHELSRQNKEIQKQIADLRIRLASADLFVREVKKSQPELPRPEAIAQLPTAFDELYGAFEDAFRGSEQVIKQRVAPYLGDVLSSSASGPIVDIGSGRGEWLEVLKEAGVPAYGVEINETYVERCKSRGLDVRLEDALSHLKSVPESSLRAVSAIQVVEHFELDALIELIDRAIAALAPGGILIFETPNPDNLTVGSSSFYIDPTHERPLPAALLSFLVDCRGMVDVETRFLNRQETEMLKFPSVDNPWNSDVAKLINVINSRIYGAQDYAIVARRA